PSASPGPISKRLRTNTRSTIPALTRNHGRAAGLSRKRRRPNGFQAESCSNTFVRIPAITRRERARRLTGVGGPDAKSKERHHASDSNAHCGNCDRRIGAYGDRLHDLRAGPATAVRADAGGASELSTGDGGAPEESGTGQLADDPAHLRRMGLQPARSDQ